MKKIIDHYIWVVFVAFVLLALWGVATILPGTGVQHRLDAKKGLGHVDFVASLREASKWMSPAQIEALDWALGNLDAETFVGRYGVMPTVRQVVVGEVASYVQAKRARIAVLEAKLPSLRNQVESSEIERRKMLGVLQASAPVITKVGYADRARISNSTKSRCKDEDCSVEVDDGDRLLVWFKLDKPKGLDLKILPCRLIYSVKSRVGEHLEEFNCLARERAPNGEFYARLSRTRGVDPSDVIVRIEAMYEDAQVQHPSKYWRGLYVLPELPIEVVELKQTKARMKLVLGYKSLM